MNKFKLFRIAITIAIIVTMVVCILIIFFIGIDTGYKITYSYKLYKMTWFIINKKVDKFRLFRVIIIITITIAIITYI